MRRQRSNAYGNMPIRIWQPSPSTAWVANSGGDVPVVPTYVIPDLQALQPPSNDLVLLIGNIETAIKQIDHITERISSERFVLGAGAVPLVDGVRFALRDIYIYYTTTMQEDPAIGSANISGLSFLYQARDYAYRILAFVVDEVPEWVTLWSSRVVVDLNTVQGLLQLNEDNTGGGHTKTMHPDGQFRDNVKTTIVRDGPTQQSRYDGQDVEDAEFVVRQDGPAVRSRVLALPPARNR